MLIHISCIIIQHINNTSTYTGVYAHICTAIYKSSKARELSLAHTRDLFMDSVSERKVQNALDSGRASMSPSYRAGQGSGAGTCLPCPCSRACRTGLEGTTTAPLPWSKGLFIGKRGKVLPWKTAHTDTAESFYLDGYLSEAQKSAKKF